MTSSLTQASPSSSAQDPYAPLYQLGLGVQEQNSELIVTGSAYGNSRPLRNWASDGMRAERLGINRFRR